VNGKPDDARPDPDQLLDRLKQEEAHAQRGKLKIFFGASPGVGKTYAMLAEARRLRAQGLDVVVGVVETHGRSETAVLTEGLERLPRGRSTITDAPCRSSISTPRSNAGRRSSSSMNSPIRTPRGRDTRSAGRTWKNCSPPASMS
jgi:hypothetical protein